MGWIISDRVRARGAKKIPNSQNLGLVWTPVSCAAIHNRFQKLTFSQIWAILCYDETGTTKYQPIPPHIDPAPPYIDQNCLLLTQYQNVSSSSALYWPNKHHISTHTALYWPSTTKCQPVQPHTNPATPTINLYRLLLTKYHHVSNQYSLLLTQFRYISYFKCHVSYSNVRLSFVDLRWAQLYVSLVWIFFLISLETYLRGDQRQRSEK